MYQVGRVRDGRCGPGGRRGSCAAAFALLIWTWLLPVPADEPVELAPNELPGLVAWYTGRPVEGKLRDGDGVRLWRDASGNGHDLTLDPLGLPALFRTRQVNEKPAIRLGPATAFDVAEPFELQDFTIVLVYRNRHPKRGLLSGGAEDSPGILLRDDGKLDRFAHPRGSADFNQAVGLAQDRFTLSVLGRHDGQLHAIYNGEDRSAGQRVAPALRVAQLFHLQLTKFVTLDSKDMEVAELVFFDRYLDLEERNACSAFLSREYALPWQPELQAEIEEPIEPEEPAAAVWTEGDALARLDTPVRTNLNAPAQPIEWGRVLSVASPFRVSREQPSRLYATQTRNPIHVVVNVQVRASSPDVQVRLLALKNNETYIPGESIAVPIDGAGDPTLRTFRLQSTLSMEAGDFVEIIASREGAEGTAEPLDASSLWLIVGDAEN